MSWSGASCVVSCRGWSAADASVAVGCLGGWYWLAPGPDSVRYAVRCWRAYRSRLCGFPGPDRCLADVRRWRRSELSRAAAISVIAVTAIGAGKLRSSAASWTRAAATAQIRIVAAAQAMTR